LSDITAEKNKEILSICQILVTFLPVPCHAGSKMSQFPVIFHRAQRINATLLPVLLSKRPDMTIAIQSYPVIALITALAYYSFVLH
jgi:hypothetical protein